MVLVGLVVVIFGFGFQELGFVGVGRFLNLDGVSCRVVGFVRVFWFMEVCIGWGWCNGFGFFNVG